MKWSEYNQSLVIRGVEILLGFVLLTTGILKRDEQRQGGVRNHSIPNTFLLLLGYSKVISSTILTDRRRNCKRAR
jgi:hypothetical protein